MKTIAKFLFSLCLFALVVSKLQAQIAINQSRTNPDASTILDLNTGNSGVNKGLLPPQVALTANNSAYPVTSPATGLVVYNTATAGTAPNNVIPGYYFWNGTLWAILISGNTATNNYWSTMGNYGTNSNTNFIGTTDAIDLEFRVSNQFSGLIDYSSANTFFGYLSGSAAGSTGTYNTGIGYKALASLTNGFNNTANGAQALNKNTSGYGNTANGYYALFSNTTGASNTAEGAYALNANTTGYYNTAIGNYALSYNTTGVSNTALGVWALNSNTSGYGNTANGIQTLYNNSTGVYNTASGNNALYANTSGSFNTAYGNGALYTCYSGFNNTASGSLALYSNSSGSSNTADGANTLYTNTADANTAVGDSALASNTTGTSNAAVGYQALASNKGGYENTAIGTGALYSNNGLNNTATGFQSLYSNTSGASNTATGGATMYSNTSGGNNTADGNAALYDNTTGFYNTAGGSSALFSNTKGSRNTANGNSALGGNTTGSSGTAMGYSALSQSTGDANTALGDSAGYSITTGSSNTAVGYKANVSPGTLTNAAAIGANATATASNTMVLGNNANVGIGVSPQNNLSVQYGMNIDQSGTNNGAIGNNNSADDAITFGNGSGEGIASKRTSSGNQYGLDFYTNFTNRMCINQSGYVGIGTTTQSYPLTVQGTVTTSYTNYGYLSPTGTTGHVTGGSGNVAVSIYSNGRILSNSEIDVLSDERLKNFVDEINPDVALTAICKLRPLHFTWKPEASEEKNVKAGFYAQEVQSVIPEAVTVIPGTLLKDEHVLNYDMLTTYAIASIQEQQKIIDNLTLTISRLKEEVSIKSQSEEKEIAELKQMVYSLTQAQVNAQPAKPTSHVNQPDSQKNQQSKNY